MNIQIVRFEGTAEELDQLPELRAMLTTAAQTPQEDVLLAPSRADLLPEDIEAFLSHESRSERQRALFRAFLQEIEKWKDVEVTWPYSQKPERERTSYVRARRRGTPVGAFVYLRNTGKMHFRLPAGAASERRYAVAREVHVDNPSQITLVLRDHAQLAEAIALAREAYEATRS